MILCKTSSIINHIIMRRRCSSLINILSNHIKIKIIWNNTRINYCSRRYIWKSSFFWASWTSTLATMNSWATILYKKFIINFFLYNNFSKFWLIIFNIIFNFNLFKCWKDLFNFFISNFFNLTIAYAISIKNNIFWQLFVFSKIS